MQGYTGEPVRGNGTAPEGFCTETSREFFPPSPSKTDPSEHRFPLEIFSSEGRFSEQA